MNIDVSLFTITTVLLAAALATVAWMWARLRKRVKAEQQLREEAEVRERQFAAEQERILDEAYQQLVALSER